MPGIEPRTRHRSLNLRCESARARDPWRCVCGGSVASSSYALVHDAAGPLTPRRVFDRVLIALRAGHRNVVPVLPVSDTVRTLLSQRAKDVTVLSAPVERARLRAVQTPQGFAFKDLVAAHERFECDAPMNVTDDARLLEAMGIPAVGVEGSHEAFKITHPLDFELTRMLCQRKEDA